MRVELVYAPGCNTYRKALHILETVIAEERLPIAIEMTEDCATQHPSVRVNGDEVEAPGVPCLERLRNAISEKWREFTVPA